MPKKPRKQQNPVKRCPPADQSWILDIAGLLVPLALVRIAARRTAIEQAHHFMWYRT